MKGLLAVVEKAREKPQKYHWKTMTEKDIITTQSMERADFLRARPEYRKAMPGTMRRTRQAERMMKAWSPDWYHWLRFSVAGEGSC
jgi:hypothetical protein